MKKQKQSSARSYDDCIVQIIALSTPPVCFLEALGLSSRGKPLHLSWLHWSRPAPQRDCKHPSKWSLRADKHFKTANWPCFLPIPFSVQHIFNQQFSVSLVLYPVCVCHGPELPTLGGHGMAFTISPSVDFTGAMATQYFGILNSTSNGLPSNHLVAVELDAVPSPDLKDINDSHVGIDVTAWYPLNLLR
ncbi:hypothetical protein NC652_022393 [Populus alba x Populus x berolinensis]|nr:hypothetical protein NC652_022393 [Populus alba x Populus x berolinensis]